MGGWVGGWIGGLVGLERSGNSFYRGWEVNLDHALFSVFLDRQCGGDHFLNLCCSYRRQSKPSNKSARYIDIAQT